LSSYKYWASEQKNWIEIAVIMKKPGLAKTTLVWEPDMRKAAAADAAGSATPCLAANYLD